MTEKLERLNCIALHAFAQLLPPCIVLGAHGNVNIRVISMSYVNISSMSDLVLIFVYQSINVNIPNVNQN